MAAGRLANESVADSDDRAARCGRALRDHVHSRPSGLPRRCHIARLGQQWIRRCRPADPHRHRGGSHHRRRPGVLHHDRGPDAGVNAVRPPHPAQFHPRPRHPDHARDVRGDVRLRRAQPRLDLARQPRRLRPASVDNSCARPRARIAGRPHLLHPPRSKVDPATRSDRVDRPRPLRGDRGGSHRLACP